MEKKFSRVFKNLLYSTENSGVHSCILFSGENSGESFSYSFILAKKLLCIGSHSDINSCSCDSCNRIKRISHPDVYFLYPNSLEKDSLIIWREFVLDFNGVRTKNNWIKKISETQKINNLNIPKEKVSELLNWLTIPGVLSEKKVVFIFCPECLNAYSANALLKTLEEPTENIFFILCSEDKSNILPTIISRCSQINVTSEKKTYLGNVLSFQEENNDLRKNTHMQNFQSWMRYCFMKDFKKLVEMSTNLNNTSKHFQQVFFQYGYEILNAAINFNKNNNINAKLNNEEMVFLEKFSPKLKNYPLIREIISRLLTFETFLSQNANIKFLFLDISFRILAIF